MTAISDRFFFTRLPMQDPNSQEIWFSYLGEEGEVSTYHVCLINPGQLLGGSCLYVPLLLFLPNLPSPPLKILPCILNIPAPSSRSCIIQAPTSIDALEFSNNEAQHIFSEPLVGWITDWPLQKKWECPSLQFRHLCRATWHWYLKDILATWRF